MRQRYSKDIENGDLLIHLVLFWGWLWDLDAEESFDLRFVPEEVVWPAPEHNGSISYDHIFDTITTFAVESGSAGSLPSRSIQALTPPWHPPPSYPGFGSNLKVIFWFRFCLVLEWQYSKLGGKGNLGGHEKMQWSNCRYDCNYEIYLGKEKLEYIIQSNWSRQTMRAMLTWYKENKEGKNLEQKLPHGESSEATCPLQRSGKASLLVLVEGILLVLCVFGVPL